MATDNADEQVAKKMKLQEEEEEKQEVATKKSVDWVRTPTHPPAEGSCEVWLPRKQRYCSHHATLGSKKCTTHASLDTAAPQKEDVSVPKEEIKVSSRKSNFDRHLKRMLNPFSIPPLKESPQWSELFANPKLPLCIDIGCSKGLYIRDYRDKQTAEWNFLGVEIFEPYVVAANAAEAQRRAATPSTPHNLAYIHANINNSLDMLVKDQKVARISLLFPDPWGCGLKKDHKNKKRRVMSATFAAQLAAVMPPGSEFYLASDYEDLALDIRSHLLATKAFVVPTEGPFVPSITAPAIREMFQSRDSHKHRLLDTEETLAQKAAADSDNTTLWLSSIPLGVPTERDVICENQWRPVYRLVLHRVDN